MGGTTGTGVTRMGMDIVERCEIAAPIDTVWKVLTDVSGYADWNPFIVSARAKGDPAAQGTRLTFRVQAPNGTRAPSAEQVVEAHAPTQDAQGNWMARWAYVYCGPMSGIGLIRAKRVQTLTQAAGGPTVYESSWQASGMLIKMVLSESDIAAGMHAQTAALKQVSEQPSTA